ncbi:MAG: aspartate--tRNA ligase [Desulfobacteraceae bacterium]|nr:MAG: aspartate--tRNA ligase [Desulfobacteraceae bacterium]
MDWKERVFCGELTTTHAGKEVLLMGWVDAIRDHGNVLFIHLRDIRGIVQVVFNPQTSKDSYEKAATLREEYAIQVRGTVAIRERGTENPNLDTGGIEVLASELVTFSKARILPFQISEKAMVFGEDIQASPENVDEDLRLRYRYLDLRRPSMQDIFIKRYHIIKVIREYLDQLNFIEVETPFLTKSTPEGARDYLVPSRLHQGRFYALPQSPQLFKQLLMMSGIDRYFQIARCFRDEDLRPNRQPEFTQLDLEASFIDEEFIYEVTEELTVRMFALGGITLLRPFPRMTFEKAMDHYGTDRPDLRFDMPFEDVTDIVKDTDYSVFRQIIDSDGRIKGFCIKGQAKALSKNVLQNEYSLKIAPSFGAKGMTWMKVIDGSLESNIVQFFSRSEQSGLMKRFGAEEGDVLIMIADVSRDLVDKVLCSLRLDLAERLRLVPDDLYCPLWVTDFPLFELKDGELKSQHHPFTMPDRPYFDPTDTRDLMGINSRAYDLVINGEELGGGSMRIHRMDIQKKIFQALGLSRDEVEAKFGFFLRALEYGAPPHGGLALGIDRIIAMILKTSSIREVMAFPKNRSAFCPLTNAPSPADKSHLEELNLGLGFRARRHRRKPFGSPREDIVEYELKRPEKISRDEVAHVAKLARLRLDDSEAALYQKDLNSILDYVDALKELDTEKTLPMSHVLEVKNVWRDDKPGKEKETDPLVTNAPMSEKGYFKVPKILEG